MDIQTRCNLISNAYYNLGLELAKQRDLTNSAAKLKRSLQFNKNQTDARNLLGLIYYEIGEVADALLQWVISLNLSPKNNDADRYLDEVQRKASLIDGYTQAISRYNQALSHAQAGNDEIAVSLLLRVVKDYPAYLKANLLLGLLYFANDDRTNARKYFQEALKVDRNNPQAVMYLNELKGFHIKTKKTGRKETPDAPLPVVSEVKDVIVPRPYRESTGLQTLLNILIGIIIGAAIVFFVYLPTYKSRAVSDFNSRLISTSEKLSRNNAEIAEAKAAYEDMKGKYEALQKEIGALDGPESLVSQAQKLAGVYDALSREDYENAARLFSKIRYDCLSDVDDDSGLSLYTIYDHVSEVMESTVSPRFLSAGDSEAEQGNYSKAIDYHDLSIMAAPDNPGALFRKGQAFKNVGNTEKSSQIFHEIIDLYPDSEEAEKARRELADEV